MASENVARFEELLKGDAALQAKLQELATAFEGDKTNEQAVFDATIGKLAAEAGLPFTLEEGREFAAAGRELGDAELEAVAGGGWCYAIGGASDVEATCGDSEFHACAYVGVGFGLGPNVDVRVGY